MTGSGDSLEPGVARMRAGLRRRSDEAEARIARGLGVPALFAIAAGSVVSSVFFALGVVAGDALGLTPVAFLAAAGFFVLTMLAYVEGSSLHPERGGASMFARYAFNELWSFVAGWAILLDLLIVMAIGALSAAGYLGGVWDGLDAAGAELAVVAAVLGWVAWSNHRGQTAHRYGLILRLTLMGALLSAAIVVVGLLQLPDPGRIADSVELGTTPTWEGLIFAAVVATAALTGIEAASGLAGELRVRRRELRRVVVVATVGITVLFLGLSVVALMALPVENGTTELGTTYIDMPLLGVVAQFDPPWLADLFRYAVGIGGAAVLVQAVNGQLLGIGRLVYALGIHRQIPSALSRLDAERGTPYVTIGLATALAFALACTSDIKLLAGIFAFGATLAFTLAHLAIVVLRFREPARPRAFRVPLNVSVRGTDVPLPSVLGALLGAGAWISVIVFHEGARYVGGAWLLLGLALYVVYRKSQGKSLTKRFAIPDAALREPTDSAYGSILVPVFGERLDDDIVGTAGRLAAERAEEGEGGAMLEALWVIQIPMSLPIDARVPEERLAQARRALARAKEVGEEYEGVEVATAMVRGRTVGAAIVSEARRRGVEAIVLAAEAPSRIRGGAILGGHGLAKDRFAGDLTRYVVEKAPCNVILTAPPAEVVEQAAAMPPDEPAPPSG